MIAIVFPGQGSQYLGMARDFYDNFEAAKNVFKTVEECTKIKIKEIIFNNSENLLDITEYTQICVFTASMAIFEVFKEVFGDNIKNSNIEFVLGHSLGEYTALTASNSLSIEDCAKLLTTRGKLMQDAFEVNKSGMAAVIGLDCVKVEMLIDKYSIDINIANDNAPGQVVISGIVESIKKSEVFLLNNGAKKIVYLNVSAAFHSKLMKTAEEEMKKYLINTNFQNPEYQLISNFTGTASKEHSVILENLSKQMSNKVKWTDSIKLLEKMKVNNIIEIGPNKILTGLIRRISKKFNLYNFNEVKDIGVIKNAI